MKKRSHERFSTYYLVEVSKRFFWGVGKSSAVLRDLSEEGVRIDFVEDDIIFKSEQTIWIHFSPIFIKGKLIKRFKLKAEIRWFDKEKSALGARFLKLSSGDKEKIAFIIEAVLSEA